jgi:hypothetical protein
VRQGRNQILDFSPARRGIGFWIEEKEAISKSQPAIDTHFSKIMMEIQEIDSD